MMKKHSDVRGGVNDASDQYLPNTERIIRNEKSISIG